MRNAGIDTYCLAFSENLWSMQDACVEVEPNPAAQAGTLPKVNPGWRLTATRSRNEENGRHIDMTKKMVSEFGATLGCKGCLEIRQPHTQECRARITAKMEQYPAHAKRLEQNATKRLEVVRSRSTCCWKKQQQTCPSAHGKTPLWRHKRQTSLVCCGAARLEKMSRCNRQPAASERWNHVATTTCSADWKCATGPTTVDDCY